LADLTIRLVDGRFCFESLYLWKLECICRLHWMIPSVSCINKGLFILSPIVLL
jgi:hypothetical protein